MNRKLFLVKLEKYLSEKHPQVNFKFYISRRRRYVLMALEKSFVSYDHKDIITDIEKFWLKHRMQEFEFLNPPLLVKTVRWKFDYLLFRKTSDPV